MAKISTYSVVSPPTLNDMVIGTDVNNSNITKNFLLSDIQSLFGGGGGGSYVPYTGATGSVDLGPYDLSCHSATIGNEFFVDLIRPNVNNALVTQDSGGTNVGLVLDYTLQEYTLGDVYGQYNNTYLIVNDAYHYIGLSGALSVSGSTGNAGDVLTSNGAGDPSWNPVSSLITNYYGSFYDTVIQTATLANTAYAMILRSVDSSATNGVSVVNGTTGLPTRITVDNAGTYNIQFSSQLARTSGGASAVVDIWLKQGTTNVPSSNTKVTFQANAGFVVAAWNFFITLAANEYVELMWATTDTSITMTIEAANGVHPVTPSVIATVNKVS